MKKLAIMLGLAVTLGVTNPKKSDYINYSISHNICKRFENNGLIVSGCQAVMLLQKDPVQNLLDVTTKHSNYILFSVFETDVMGIKIKTLAIAGQFISLSGG